jgi:hypothetical protein
LESILRLPPVRYGHCTAHAQLRTKLVPRMLGTVRRLQGRHAEAQAILQTVLQAFPTDTVTLYNLGLLYVDRREANALPGVVQQLMALPGGAISGGLLAALWHLRNGDPTLAGPIIDDLIVTEPRDTRARMLRAEWLCSMRAPIDAQIQALRDILRIAPGNLETQHWLQVATQARQAELQSAANRSLPFVQPVVAAAAVHN